jgi:hypothetical protein
MDPRHIRGLDDNVCIGHPSNGHLGLDKHVAAFSSFDAKRNHLDHSALTSSHGS